MLPQITGLATNGTVLSGLLTDPDSSGYDYQIEIDIWADGMAEESLLAYSGETFQFDLSGYMDYGEMTVAVRAIAAVDRDAGSALKPVLLAAGWRARAAGWFTKNLRPAVDAVIAVTVASEHHAAGSASATIMVGLRDEAIEEVVEQVAGPQKPRYQGRTWVAPLGYLLPDPGYRAGERNG